MCLSSLIIITAVKQGPEYRSYLAKVQRLAYKSKKLPTTWADQTIGALYVYVYIEVALRGSALGIGRLTGPGGGVHQ